MRRTNQQYRRRDFIIRNIYKDLPYTDIHKHWNYLFQFSFVHC